MVAWGLLCGAIVGLSLGMTGGGGAIFAVPMLVYGLAIAPREAIGVSLAAVGSTACFGFLTRWRTGQLEIRTGMIVALGGVLGAPVGSWLARRIPEPTLLTLFAALMLLVAWRMWRGSTQQPDYILLNEKPDDDRGISCHTGAGGSLILTSKCAAMLALIGLATGVLSGLFGVGGGFVIVPALVLIGHMPIQRAIGTSLFVVSCVSAAGLTSYLVSGGTISWVLTGFFLCGGIGGLLVGQSIGKRLPTTTLQRIFAMVIVAVALFVFFQRG